MLDQGESEYPMTTQDAEAASTEEELDATATLLTLGTVRDDTLDEDTKNAELMPIGGQNAPTDIAPEPIRLDQVSVDNAITGIIQTEEVNKDKPTAKTDQDTNTKRNIGKDVEREAEPQALTGTENAPVMKGALKTKTYTLKKKTDSKRCSFKCSECKVVKKTIKELNIHHKKSHNPQICGICSQSFKLASSLTRHMYDHNKLKYHCDQCDYSCHFESEMQTHRIVHRKNPFYQCMKANCGKWFR